MKIISTELKYLKTIVFHFILISFHFHSLIFPSNLFLKNEFLHVGVTAKNTVTLPNFLV